jgi:hypothetical protein
MNFEYFDNTTGKFFLPICFKFNILGINLSYLWALISIMAIVPIVAIFLFFLLGFSAGYLKAFIYFLYQWMGYYLLCMSRRALSIKMDSDLCSHPFIFGNVDNYFPYAEFIYTIISLFIQFFYFFKRGIKLNSIVTILIIIFFSFCWWVARLGNVLHTFISVIIGFFSAFFLFIFVESIF